MKIRYLLLIVCIIAASMPVNVPAQQGNLGWTLVTDSPFLFVGEKLQGYVTGPPNSFYQLRLVNRTSYVDMLIYSGNTSHSGNSSFSKALIEGWVESGQYTLNLTVNHYLVDFVPINIIYDEEYLHQKEHSWVRRMFGTFTDWLNDISDNQDYLIDEEKEGDWIDLIQTFLIIAGSMALLRYVLWPRFVAWSEITGRRGKARGRTGGIQGDIIEFLDLKHERIPELNQANIAPMTVNLNKLGIDDTTLECIVWEVTGSPGVGRIAKTLSKTFDGARGIFLGTEQKRREKKFEKLKAKAGKLKKEFAELKNEGDGEDAA